jgi:hypothetical protein
MRKGLALKLNFQGKCICGLSVLEASSLDAGIMEVPITINKIDKKRSIAWEHFSQIFHVLRWVVT